MYDMVVSIVCPKRNVDPIPRQLAAGYLTLPLTILFIIVSTAGEVNSAGKKDVLYSNNRVTVQIPLELLRNTAIQNRFAVPG